MYTSVRLSKDRKPCREKVPIALNDVIDFYQQSISDLQHKWKSVGLQFQTAQFGIGENPKQAEI